MKVVTKIVGGKPTQIVVLTDEEREQIANLKKHPAFAVWRGYIAVEAGIRKDRLYERNLADTKDFDPRGSLGYLQALEEATDLNRVLNNDEA
jgi:hypothetical protein